MASCKSWIMAGALAVTALNAQAQDTTSTLPPEGQVVIACLSKNAAFLSRAPDSSSDVAAAVLTSCEQERLAFLAFLKAHGQSQARIETLESYIKRSAQRQVIWERAARETVREK
jgi:hypothetical protein